MHTVVTPTEHGRTTVAEATVVIRRKLGANEIRFEVRENTRFEEDAAGTVTSFRLDRDENGARSSAQGTCTGAMIIGTVFRPNGATEASLAIPAGVVIAGDRRTQELLAANSDRGAVIRTAAPTLVGARLQLVTSTATCTGADAKGNPTFDVVTDIMPVPARVVVDKAGEMLSMTMSFGPFNIELRPAAGPPALLGGSVDPQQMVRHAGPAPGPLPVHRYRLPEGATAPRDAFQTQDGDTVTIVAKPTADAGDIPPALLAALLAAEAQIESGDAELAAWVRGILAALPESATTADKAEALRLAVRSHISQKDLSVGDGSALETFHSRKGDCTEHANLLCAALRIAGIPARVDVGLVFSTDMGSWCGHAWNSAIIAGRWTHLDSAYPGLERSQYLRLGGTGGSDAATAKSTTAALMAAMAGLLGKTIETID
jgi:hypothetical protein